MIYLITYNHTQTVFDPKEIHSTITKLPGLTDWWHYLPNIYLVDSTSAVSNIANTIIRHHPGLLFLAVKVDLSQNNGVLNKDAWAWINKKTRSTLKLKPATSPNLLSFLPPITPRTTTSPSLSITEVLKKIRESQ